MVYKPIHSFLRVKETEPNGTYFSVGNYMVAQLISFFFPLRGYTNNLSLKWHFCHAIIDNICHLFTRNLASRSLQMCSELLHSWQYINLATMSSLLWLFYGIIPFNFKNEKRNKSSISCHQVLFINDPVSHSV